MSVFNEIRQALSFHNKSKDGKKPQMSHEERRIILIGVTVLLLVVAIVTLLTRTAIGSSGIQACRSIIFAQQRYNCIGNLANTTGNYLVCSYLPIQSSSYQCIRTVAEKRQNASICSSINSSDPMYDSCVENVSYEKNDLSLCLGLRGANESACAYAIARQNLFSSLSYCNAIGNESQRATCGYIFYYNVATSTNTPSNCGYLPNVTNGTLLSLIVSRGNTNQSGADFNYFSYTALNITPKEYCYYNVAKSTKDKSLCGYTSGTISQICNSSFSANSTASLNITSATALCAAAPSYEQALCTYGIFTEKALADQNVSSCFEITDMNYQNSCIVDLASRYNDSSYCNYIDNNNTAQQACIQSAT